MALAGEPQQLAATLAAREPACAALGGAWLAAGGGDGALRLWRWRRGAGWAAAGEARAHRYGVTAAQFARSTALLATCGVDGAARVWAPRGPRERRALAAPGAAAARAVRWATGERVCVGHDDGALRVWAARRGALLAHVRAHDGALHALAAPAHAALLLAACTQGVLKVYDFEELCGAGSAGGPGPAPLLWRDGAHEAGALCGAGWARGAATGGHDALVRLWRVRGAGGARRVRAGRALAGHTAAVSALSYARGVLASASLDRTARLWAARSGACLAVLHAHTRYLTCVALAADLRFVVTGSNDKSLRTWSLGGLSLHEELEPACTPLAHFGLGDLEGIGPVHEEAAGESAAAERGAGESAAAERGAGEAGGAGARLLGRAPHAAAVNCVAASATSLATACSDGCVRVFDVVEADEADAVDDGAALRLRLELRAHAYPALAVDWDASGAVLLSAGMDGCARLWDAESGRELATLSAGGGGLRGARVAQRRAPPLLLASDDGLAAVWGTEPVTPGPLHVYRGLSDACVCAAWARGARAGACGGAAGELLLFAPPHARVLASCTDAHDLGVLSCDFNPGAERPGGGEGGEWFLLASGGRDARVRLWWAHVGAARGRLQRAHARAAHEGAVQCVRWHRAGALLATGGDDRWARVWRVRLRGAAAELHAVCAVPTDAGGAPAVCLLGAGGAPLLAAGSLAGELALWRLPRDAQPEDEEDAEDAEGAEPRAWRTPGVLRWLREYVTRPPGSRVSAAAEARVLRAARSAALSGARLLDAPLTDLLQLFAREYITEGSEEEETVDGDEKDEVLQRLQDEILWLRRDPVPDELEQTAPHALLCPLSHRVMREPARAADGCTYERQSALHWRLASGDELVSPVTGRRLHSAALAPNYGVRDALRQYLGWPQPQPQSTSDQESD